MQKEIEKPNEKIKKYYAKTATVFPKSARFSFEKKNECFLGVSLENENFTSEKFLAMLNWVNQRFRRCNILIGDSIHRITLETNKGLSPEDSLSAALNLGRAYQKQASKILKAKAFYTEFSFITCHALQQTTEYAAFHDKITQSFLLSNKFRVSVEQFSLNYHRHHWKELNESQQQNCINKSSQYFLEEFAIFACLANRGLNVMVYPGTFSSLAEIVNGEHPDIIDELKQMTVISLNIKKKK
ncbi:tRNA-dependent cyclodipeptide synthase [Providencia vermicola]|uniref:tRNA-dependent cyclodipeptide synthase n=1 Tax=Providencia vermicola TaxID=333965 RepID=UPI0021FCB309|nr:tRNA-dependent cyclodipeptide synthase [Providencia stuartii]